ncbi:hypothetical protein, partial [Halorubrum sp. Atlit-9R]|uniref:hypothetical protein n=1 Tax=Halorubrum sp. Atlit-9R TaxID=2282127 RepID=UPI001F480C96
VHTLEYSNNLNDKKLKIGFTLASIFEITALYELHRVNDQKTKLRYTATNTALKWFVKLFMIFAAEKVVVKFLEKVKRSLNQSINKTIIEFTVYSFPCRVIRFCIVGVYMKYYQ